MNQINQIQLLLNYYILMQHKGKNTSFTSTEILEKYGLHLKKLETKKSPLSNRITAAFKELLDKKLIKQQFGQNGKNHIYNLTTDSNIDDFHNLMSELKANYNHDTIIFSEEFKNRVLAYGCEGIYDSAEGHYKELTDIELVEFMDNYLNRKHGQILDLTQ